MTFSTIKENHFFLKEKKKKNFKWLLHRIRGSNSFQFSRVHLKGVCQEVDWLFPIWKTVMTGRKRKKKKIKRPPSISMGGLLFETYSTQHCCNLRARHPQVRVKIPRQAEAWEPPGGWIPRQVKACRPPENWVPRQMEACRPPGTLGLPDPLAGWSMTTFWGPDP